MKSLPKIFVLLVIIVSHAFSQTPDSAFGYFPLHVGDVRQYSYNADIGPYLVYYFTETIMKDTTVLNGHTYFIKTTTYSNSSKTNVQLLRVDSATANVYALNDAQENLIDSLRMKAGDRQGIITCYEVSPDTVLGLVTTVKSFRYSVVGRHQLAYGLGENYLYDESMGLPYSSTLVYAKIGGKEYGKLLSVAASVEVPQEFTLNQNFPNPFNPSTTISYSIPHSTFVRLKVYDALGREVRTLVEERQAQGRHQITFEAQNCASGLYIYRIQAGTWTAARAMQIVK